MTQTQTSPSTLQSFPDKENTDIGKGRRCSGKSVFRFEMVYRVGRGAGQPARRNQAIFMSQLTAIAEPKRERNPLVLNGNAKKAPILRFSLRFAAKGMVT
jgi:hypothetical protein